MSTCGAVLLGAVAVGCSGFYGWYAATIHTQPNHQLDTWCSPRNVPPPHWSWWVHQFWLNSLGSLVGWAAAFYLIFYRVPSFHRPNGCWKVELGLADVFFFLVALLGVTGLLPWRLFNTSLK